MDCSTPSSPVFHYLPEFAQTHVHWVSDSIQSSHPLSPPSPPALSLPSTRVFSNEIALWIMGQSIGISVSASVLPMSIQGWFPLGLTGLILLCKGLSRVLQHHNLKASILQCSVFLMVQLSHHDYWENHSFDYMDLCWQSDVCAFEFAV